MDQSTLVGSGKRGRGSNEDTEMNFEDSGSLRVSLCRIHRVVTTMSLRGWLEVPHSSIDSGIDEFGWRLCFVSGFCTVLGQF